MLTKDKKSGIQPLIFCLLGPSVVAASAQQKEQPVSQVRESLVLQDENSPMDIVFPNKNSYFSEKDLEAESLEGPSSKHGGSTEKATPKTKHLRDPEELEDPGVLQHAYQGSGPTAAGLPHGSGASFAEDEAKTTAYFLIDHVAEKVAVDLETGAKTSRRTKKRDHPVEVRTRKAKAENNNDDPPPGIVLGGNGIVWIDGSGKCVQGTSSFVKFTCDSLGLGCCDEDDSCNWPSDQTATVCKNACTGTRACEDIGDGAIIEKGSCQDEYACSRLAKESTTGKIRVGKESCIGSYACTDICSQSEDCELSIGDNACIGASLACRKTGNFAAKQVLIGDNSCLGAKACEYLAFSTKKNIKIGSDSCFGESLSCYSICGYSEKCELTIGDEACTGDRACKYMGSTANDPNTNIEKIDIMDGACDGEEACDNFGGYSESIKIGKVACQGMKACDTFGYYTTKKVEVGDYSCDGDNACRLFAVSILDKDVKVDKNECIGNSECFSVACYSTAKVPNKDGLCPAS